MIIYIVSSFGEICVSNSEVEKAPIREFLRTKLSRFVGI